MHHIEDALASVLDDMKQLDFSTSNVKQCQAVMSNASNKPLQQHQTVPIITNNNQVKVVTPNVTIRDG